MTRWSSSIAFRPCQYGLSLVELLMALALSGLVAAALLSSARWLSSIHSLQSDRVAAWETELVVRQTWQSAFRRLRQGIPWDMFSCDREHSEQADGLLGLPRQSSLSVVGVDHESAPSRAVADSDVVSIRHYGCGGDFTEQYYVGRNPGGEGAESRGLYYRERRQGQRWSYSQEVVLGLARMKLQRCDPACQPGQQVPGFHPAYGVRMAFHWPEASALPFTSSYLTLPVSNLRASTLLPSDTSIAGSDN